MKSEQLFAQAARVIPGGVNSPVRAFGGVGGKPVFIDSAESAYLIDSDGRRLVDYICSWGAVIVGHAHPEIVAAVSAQLKSGLSYGAPTELESMLAQKLLAAVPSMEMLRMVSSGTEATMTALRLARGYTSKSKIIKFNGCYHGHSDCLLVQAGSGGLTLGQPNSAGVPRELVAATLTCDYNDSATLKALFTEHGGDIAAVILEPIAGNMNFVRAQPEFLEDLQHLCAQERALLIFDEVMTGLRVHRGGAQAILGIIPDITCLGKVIGGGMPAAAVGGRREIMQYLAPTGSVYQAGTLSGNPIAMRAGLATLEIISADADFYNKLEIYNRQLLAGIAAAFAAIDLPVHSDYAGGMFGFFPGQSAPVTSLLQPSAAATEFFRAFYHQMLAHGVYLAPSMFEAGFISSGHDHECLQRTLSALEKSLAALAQSTCVAELRRQSQQ